MARMSAFTRGLQVLGLSIAFAVPSHASPADGPPGDGTPGESVVISSPDVIVERVETKESKPRTLGFLKDNRAFFRSQLDLLRILAGNNREGDASAVDSRFLEYAKMLEAIRAARDSVASGQEWIQGQQFVDAIDGVQKLEEQMDRMQEILVAQRDRLGQLEDDFSSRSRTSLVVLLRGVPRRGVPETLELADEDGDSFLIRLTPEVQATLAAGGSAELLHEFVEPRVHDYTLTCQGPDWLDTTPMALRLEPERDRMTFLEIDLGSLDRPTPSTAQVWVR